jgi:arylsulfatase A-like enzyme
MELVSLQVRRLALDELAFVGSDVWWTVPLVDVLLFLLVAAGLVVARLAWRGGPWWQVELWILTFLALIGVLYSLPGLHRIAALLVAAGVATQAVRITSRKPERFHRLVRRSVPWLLLAAVVGGTVVRGREIVRERRGLAALQEAQANTPNILLIVLDTVRAMDLGLYGYGRPTTPELNAWAARGVIYRRAFSTAPWTLPSHASMFTGRLVHEMSADWMVPLDDQWPTLAEVLARKGYATAGFSANTDYVSGEVGLARGFAHFDDYSLTPGLILRSSALGRAVGRNQLIRRIIGNDKLLGRKNAPDIGRAFLNWIERRQGRPWFAFLNYYDAHRPYQPPAPYDTMFASPDVRPDPRFRQDEDPEHPWSARDARNFIAAYDGAIAYLDAELGKLFTELERRGEFQRTLVILTSDHGEEFGEHRLYDHGHSLYLASLHVPLMLWWPGSAPAGLNVHEAVSLRDIPATVATAAGIGADSPFPGRSLSRFWSGEAGGPDTVVSGVRKVALQPTWFPASRGDLIALAVDSLRFIRNLGDRSEELYNYLADPGERVRLDTTGPGRISAERFRARTDALLAGTTRGAELSQ